MQIRANSIFRSAASLALVAVMGVTLLAAVNKLTAARIAEQEKKAILDQLGQLVSPDRYNNELQLDLFSFQDELHFPRGQTVIAYRARMDGNPVAAVLKIAAVNGYNGRINLLVGIMQNGTLGGVRVISHKETPGLGDDIEVERSDWILGFFGRALGNPKMDRWAVKRDGGDFDQFTGATITPRAVVDAVRLALEYFEGHKSFLFESPSDFPGDTGLVVLLGLCPLLAVTNTAINGLGLGLATILTLVFSNLAVSLARGVLRPEIRIPAYVLIIASVVTVIQLLMQAWFYDLYRVLGIFIPLIVTNCAIIGRAEAFASRNSPLPSVADGFATGLGFCLALVTLGALREIIGQGTLFSRAGLMFGDLGASLELIIIPNHPGFLLALLPPGAFISLGILIAGRNWLDSRLAAKQALASPGLAE
jgi:electron transport complex protein RnfE